MLVMRSTALVGEVYANISSGITCCLPQRRNISISRIIVLIMLMCVHANYINKLIAAKFLPLILLF